MHDEGWISSGPFASFLDFLIFLSGDPEMSTHQKTVAFVIIFILFLAIAVWYIIQLYWCVKEKTLLSEESRHSQVFPHLRPVTLKQHKQVTVISLLYFLMLWSYFKD